MPNIALYGSYSEGVSQTFNLTARDGNPLPPTEARQVELGVKQAYMDERLVLTTALFKTNKKNVAVADLDNSGFYHVEAGQESRGLEVELVGRLNPALNVSIAYTHALSTDDAGNPLLGLAKNQINVWTQYRFLGGDWAGWNIAGGVTARSGVDYLVPFFNVNQRNPGNARWDSVVGYDAKSWGAKFGVRNIANRVLFTPASTVGAAEVEPGRTYTLTGYFKF
jgi:outer membrane receptor for ferric coprogen and ferric-rhodotorulic acid